MINLSKSKYCQGIQCPKSLWMNLNKKDSFDDSVVDEVRLQTGNDVGDLAMGYYGEFVKIEYGEYHSDMIADTQMYLDAGEIVIAEASFAFEGNFCSVDILKVRDDGSVDIIEVKSSTSLKEIYLDDMAYQYYVVSKCGYIVNSISLMLLNKTYIRKGDIDLHQLFVVEDYTNEVKQMQADIPNTIIELKEVANQKNEPDSEEYIGTGCRACGYRAFCWRNIPENSVFDIGFGLWGSKKEDMYYNGIITMEDALKSGLITNNRQLRQIKTKVNGLPPHVNKEGIRKFLDTLWYPIYYFDFETWQQAIPLFDGVYPYAQIPTQYSLHIQNEPGGELMHKEFLGKEGEDPRRAIAEQICSDIPVDACVIAYYASFEKSRIKELAEIFPSLSDHLMAINNNTRDLIIPFKDGHYYCESMGGSTSIKAVLPALFPNESELDYNVLDLVHNGSEAMNAFATLHEQSFDDVEKIRTALLKYCALDTLAMVRILDYLRDIAQ